MQIGYTFATYSTTDGGQTNPQFREPSAISDASPIQLISGSDRKLSTRKLDNCTSVLI
jgi:hypothetical protein